MSSKLTTSYNPNVQNQPHCQNGASSIIINQCTNKIRPNIDCLKKCDLNNTEPNVFTTQKDYIKHILHGDLYVIGRLWLDAMKFILIGTEANILKIPTVEAADKKTNEHDRPKSMKYTELPLEGELHSSYKDFEEENSKCKDINKKLLHSFMLPYVSYTRKCLQDTYYVFRNEARDSKNELKEFVGEKKDFLVDYFRNPNNIYERYTLVTLGGISGFLYAYRKGLPSKAFYTIAGLLAAGALCFPEETDKNFKTGLYYSTLGVLKFYNLNSGSNYKLPGKLPCKERTDDKILPQQLKINCPDEKKK